MPLLWPRPTSIFAPPTTLDHFLSSPLGFFIYYLHALLVYLRGPAYQPPSHTCEPRLRVVCLSDTHSKIPTQPIPNGEILIHAGDLAGTGTAEEIQSQIDWLKTLPHTEKIVIAGNHDSYIDPRARPHVKGSTPNGTGPDSTDAKSQQPPSGPVEFDWGPIHYLEKRSITLGFPHHGNRRLHIYGAPQIPRCGPADFAFQYDEAADEHAWAGTVPVETDILITHTPPRFHLDLPAGLGCAFLLKELWRVRPTLHVCGHIHSGHGCEQLWWDEAQRAYERVGARRRKRRVLAPEAQEAERVAREQAVLVRLVSWIMALEQTLFNDAFDISSWMDGMRVLWYGVRGILWSRIWGGAAAGGTTLVNASLTYQTTNKLGNPVQVVDI